MQIVPQNPEDSSPEGLACEVLSRLKGVKKDPKGWMALCPAHPDKNPSLHVSIGDKGIATHCFAGCKPEDVHRAMGFNARDLFYSRSNGSNGKAKPSFGSPTNIYDYRNADGSLVFQVLRYPPKKDGKKVFSQRQPDGKGGWVWNTKGVEKVLYRLPQLLAADPDEWVFIVEGEKDADTLHSVGLTATCNPGGATKWHVVKDDSALHNRRVAIIADKDEAGRKHVREVAERLYGKAQEIKVLELPGDGVKDATDWFNAGGTAAELLRLVEATAVYDPSTTGTAASDLVCYKDIEPEITTWLWPERIPAGELTLLYGDPERGKSIFTIDVIFRITTGAAWPGTTTTAERGSVILLAAEDSASKTIVPRMQAAGADRSKVHSINNFFDVNADLDKLRRLVQTLGDCRLIIIDPIVDYVGKVDANNNAEVRAALTPLRELAHEFGVAVIMMTHSSKDRTKAVADKAMGSRAWLAFSRAAFIVTFDPQNKDRRLLSCSKMNLGKRPATLAFTFSTVSTTVGYHPVIEWCGVVDLTAEEVDAELNRQSPPGPEPKTREEAKEWLRDYLAGGEVAEKEVRKAYEAAGFKSETMKRAKGELGVKSIQKGYGNGKAWFWSLPPSEVQVPCLKYPEHLEQQEPLTHEPEIPTLSEGLDVQDVQDVHGLGNGEHLTTPPAKIPKDWTAASFKDYLTKRAANCDDPDRAAELQAQADSIKVQ